MSVCHLTLLTLYEAQQILALYEAHFCCQYIRLWNASHNQSSVELLSPYSAFPHHLNAILKTHVEMLCQSSVAVSLYCYRTPFLCLFHLLLHLHIIKYKHITSEFHTKQNYYETDNSHHTHLLLEDRLTIYVVCFRTVQHTHTNMALLLYAATSPKT